MTAAHQAAINTAMTAMEGRDAFRCRMVLQLGHIKYRNGTEMHREQVHMPP